MNNMLFISHRDNFPYNDGGKVASFWGMKTLSKIFNVSYAFLTNKIEADSSSKYEQFGIKAYPFEKNTDDNYLDYPKTIFSKLSFKFNKFYSSAMLKMLCEIVEKDNIDIVFCSQAQVSEYGIQLKKKYPYLKIYLWEHNIEYKLVKYYAKASDSIFMKVIAYFEYIKTKMYELSAWEKFDKVFFISDLDMRTAKEYNEKFNQNNVIYTPMQEITKEKTEPIEENSFIFCGSLKSYQNCGNLRYFIKNIWLPFIKKVPDAKLYITGNSEEYLAKRLKKSVKELQSINIINLGFVEDLQKVILSKKYFISPTIFGSGIRIKVLEALSLKRVIFLTDIDYKMADCFKDMENVVLYKDSDDFYKKYTELEKNRDLYELIGTRGKDTFNSYFSESKFYERVINNLCPKEYDNYDIISLGKDCAVRRYLTMGGLKKTKAMGELSMVFDLSCHPAKTIIKFLNNNFEGYFDNLEYDNRRFNCWRNKKFKILYNHDRDCSENDREKIVDRFSKRIENFKQTVKNSPFIFFVIKSYISKKDLESLYKSLKIKRDGLPFNLLVLDVENKMHYELKNKNIKIFSIKHPFPREKEWWKPEYINSPKSLEFQKEICNFVEKVIVNSNCKLQKYSKEDMNDENGKY